MIINQQRNLKSDTNFFIVDSYIIIILLRVIHNFFNKTVVKNIFKQLSFKKNYRFFNFDNFVKTFIVFSENPRINENYSVNTTFLC